MQQARPASSQPPCSTGDWHVQGERQVGLRTWAGQTPLLLLSPWAVQGTHLLARNPSQPSGVGGHSSFCPFSASKILLPKQRQCWGGGERGQRGELRQRPSSHQHQQEGKAGAGSPFSTIKGLVITWWQSLQIHQCSFLCLWNQQSKAYKYS